LATITGTHRRRLVASSIAIILAAAMMTPATTDARGGGGGSSGGHGGGHSGAMGGGHAHFGGAGTVQNTGPAIPGPATVNRFPFAAHHSVSPHMSVSHALALHHSRAIGSHVATLGYDGIWLDNYAYAPTVVVTQPIIMLQSPAQAHASAVKTPSAAQQGIVVVRGDTKTYVTFPSAKPG
jgi:hypothetical protein